MNTSNLKVWLPFDDSPTKDLCGNSWTAYNNPTVSNSNAFFNSALQLSGQYRTDTDSGQYLSLGAGITLGGKDFTIDGWIFLDSTVGRLASPFAIFNDFNAGYEALVLEFYGSGLRLRYSGFSTPVKDGLKGTLFHFAIVYEHSKTLLSFYVNGTKVGTISETFPETAYTYFYIGRSNYKGDGVYYYKGTIDEFRIFDGEALWVSNFTPPTAIDYIDLLDGWDISYFDTERKVVENRVDIWRYENYGTADLLSVQGTTVDTPNALFHSAFVQSSRTKCFDIPATNEIWCKFDVYSEKYSRARWRAYNESNSVAGNGVCSDYYDIIYWNNNTTRQTFYSVLYNNRIQTVLLHMVSGANDGVIEAWLDGNLLYTYTGNVNNGNDFEDFFIENDNSNILISNVIISNARISLSDITTFDVTVDFDTERKVGVWRYENYGTADLLLVQGHTKKCLWALYHYGFYQGHKTKCFDIPATNEIWCKFDVYSEGNLSLDEWEAVNWDGSDSGLKTGIIGSKGEEYDRTVLKCSINSVTENFPDALRKSALLNFLLHMVSGVNDGVFEVWLDGNLLYTYTGNVNNGEPFEDFYIYTHPTGETLISNVIISNAPISLSDNVREADITVDFETCRTLFTNVTVDFDTLRNMTKVIDISVDFDTQRELVRTVEFEVDTLRKIPHKLIVAPAENGVYLDTPQTSGNKSITVNISAQQLIEQLTFVTANNVDILQQIQGQILDYQFNFRVEDFTKSGILSTCKCCSNLDELLYTQIAYTLHKETWNGGTYVKKKDEDTDTTITPSIGTTYTVTKDNAMLEKPHASASSHVMAIASKLGLTPVMLFEDFDSTIDIKQEGVTYQDLISEIFNWTSVIPHKLINVFIRYNCYTRLCYLYVIQRGYEPFVWNLTEPSTTLGRAFKADIDKDFTIHRNLVRTSFGVTRETSSIEKTTTKRVAPEYEWRPVLGNEMPEDEPDAEPVDTPEEPSEVLPSHVVTVNNGITTSIDYTYDSDGNVIRTVTHTEGGEVDTRVIVENDYQAINGQKLLYREHTIEYEWINKDWVPVDEKDIHHNYTTVGQQHVASVDRSGSIGGSFTAPARHDDKPTPFDFEVREGSGNHYIVDDNGHPFIGNGYGIYTYVDGRKIEVVGFVKERINDETGTETDTETGTLEEVKLYDSSFPVYGASRLLKITNDIKWLNRRIQENISLNVYNFPHIFDLQDRVIFMGNVYFVQSNTFTKNEHIVNQQSLELVRWY